MSTWRERFGLHALEYPVPTHSRRLDYALGAITLSGFLILILTGIWLGLLYRVGATSAYESVQALQGLDRWMRNLHYWTAHLTYLIVLLHLIRVGITGAYRTPREVTWWLGVLLLTTLSAIFLTGTIIKWDQEGYEAYAHLEEVMAYTGPLAHFLKSRFTGSAVFSSLFLAHTSLLPILLLFLILAHLALVKIHGISELPGEASSSARIPFTQVIKTISLYTGGFFILLVILASFFPASLGPAFVEGFEVTKPPWVFLWIYALENWLGMIGMIGGPALLLIGLIALPLLDRGKNRQLWLTLLLIVLLILLALALYAALSAPVPHLEMEMGELR